MEDIAIVLIAGLLAFVVGTVAGLSAEESYVQKHCDKTGQMVIDKVAYTCAKK
jgi:hypothetical protein